MSKSKHHSYRVFPSFPTEYTEDWDERVLNYFKKEVYLCKEELEKYKFGLKWNC